MKVYISADIEGCAGMAAPEEANPDHADVRYFQQQMTAEVRAACEGAIAAGATDIYVKDAHWTGRNIDPRQLPRIVRIIRGWTGHPFAMMAELDKSFDAVCFIGYHDRAGSGGNPLAHTFSGRVVAEMRINGTPVSEFHLNTFIASSYGVPVTFLSGDTALCETARKFNETLEVFPTMTGIGAATVSVHPELAVDSIRQGVERSLRRDLKALPCLQPGEFQLEIDYKQPQAAYRSSFYPGVIQKNDRTLAYPAATIHDVCTMIQFCVR
jgi:D-amino peptidase